MQGFSNATPSRGKSERLEDLVDVLKWPEDEPLAVRIIGPVYSYQYFWFTIATQNRPAPKGVGIPKLCLDHDGETDRVVTDVCPYRKSGLGRPGKDYVVNVIVRDLQNDRKGRALNWPTEHQSRPESHLGHNAYWGKRGDTRKTPVRILIIPESQISKLQSMQKANKVKDDEDNIQTYEMSDVDYGCDINISFDKNKKGQAKWDMQKGDRTPITKAEKRYLLYRPDLLKPASLEAAKSDMRDIAGKVIDRDGAPARDRDGGAPRSAKRGRPAETDDDVIDVGEADLEDEAPRSRNTERRGAREDYDEDDGGDENLDADIEADLDADDDPPRSRDRRSAPREDRDDRQVSRRSPDRRDEERAPRRSQETSRSRDDRYDDRPRRSSRDDDEIPF